MAAITTERNNFTPSDSSTPSDTSTPSDNEFTEAVRGFIEARAKVLTLDLFKMALAQPKDDGPQSADGEKADSRAASPMRPIPARYKRRSSRWTNPSNANSHLAAPDTSTQSTRPIQNGPITSSLLVNDEDFVTAFESRGDLSQLDLLANLIASFTQRRLDSDEAWKSTLQKEQLARQGTGKTVHNFAMKYNVVVAMHMQKLLIYSTGCEPEGNKNKRTDVDVRTSNAIDTEPTLGCDAGSTSSLTIRIGSPGLCTIQNGAQTPVISDLRVMAVEPFHTVDMRSGPHTTSFADGLLDAATDTVERYAAKRDMHQLTVDLDAFASSYLDKGAP